MQAVLVVTDHGDCCLVDTVLQPYRVLVIQGQACVSNIQARAGSGQSESRREVDDLVCLVVLQQRFEEGGRLGFVPPQWHLLLCRPILGAPRIKSS